MGYVESSDQNEDVLTKEANEAKEPYVFKNLTFCVCLQALKKEKENKFIILS